VSSPWTVSQRNRRMTCSIMITTPDRWEQVNEIAFE
jgi:hypothetical protein